ncbi:DLA class II histocompatibility antigen, DR-1 beta chain-like [Pogona vitticeps]
MGLPVGRWGLLLAALAACLPQVESGARPAEHFVYQWASECFYHNGTERVRLLDRYVLGRQEFVRFDSDRGEFEAVSTLGEPIARDWNSQKEILEVARRNVELCRHNWAIDWAFASSRRVQPKVKIAPSSSDSSSHNTLLICNVARFWPAEIEIKWFRNGKEEDESRVFTTDLIRNGDWTFQMAVMLEAQPERGDVYACQVEHASFPEPITVQWEPQSDSARSKMWTGVLGLVTGLVFFIAGLSLYVKSQ